MRRLARAGAALSITLAALVVATPAAHAACSADPTTDRYDGIGPRGPIGFAGDSTGIGMITAGRLVAQLVAAGWGPVSASAICGGQTTINGWSAMLTVADWHAGGFDPPVVLLGFGSNDVGICRDDATVCRSRIEAVLTAIGDRTVVWQNISHPQISWQNAWNRALSDAATNHRLLSVVDWRAAVDADPSLVGFDQVHSSGVAAYTLRARLMVQGADRWAAPQRATTPPAPLAALAPTSGAAFAPLAVPARIVDTREGRGGARLAAGETRMVDLAALTDGLATGPGPGGGGPTVGPTVVAAAVNLTVDRAAAAGFLTAWSCAGDRPNVSSLNYRAGSPRAAHAVVPVAGQKLCVYSKWATDLVVDLAGTYAPEAPLRFVPHPPLRLLDTRDKGTGLVPAGTVTRVQIPVDGDDPPKAAAFNLTAVDATRAGFVAAYPCGATVPTVSALNVDASAPRANLVQVELDADASVCLFNQTAMHLVVDLAGVYREGATGGLRYAPATPTRLLDTRTGDGGFLGATAAGQVIEIAPPPAGAAGAVVGITAVDGDGPGYVTMFPCGASAPTASNLNHGQLETVANAAIVAGPACLVTQVRTQLVVDLSGWWVVAADG